MTQTQNQLQSDDAALKAKHAAMWAMGDYPAVATEVIAPARPRPGRGHRHRRR